MNSNKLALLQQVGSLILSKELTFDISPSYFIRSLGPEVTQPLNLSSNHNLILLQGKIRVQKNLVGFGDI